MRKTAIILATAAVFDLGVVVVSVSAQEGLRPSPGTVVTAPGTTSNRDHIDQDAQLTACANGKHIPAGLLSACRNTSPDSSAPASQTRPDDIFMKIDQVNSVQACTDRRGEVVTHEGVQQCRLFSPRRPSEEASGMASGLAVQDPTGPGGNGGCIPGPPNSGGSTGPCTGAPVAIGDQGTDNGVEPWRSTAPRPIKLREEYFFLKIDAALSQRACIARRGEVVRREGVEQCRLPASAGSPDLRAAPGTGTTASAPVPGTVIVTGISVGGSSGNDDVHEQGLSLNFTKIDIHYTARACIAQRGEVVMREGVPQCALPAAPGNNRAGPNRR